MSWLLGVTGVAWATCAASIIVIGAVLAENHFKLLFELTNHTPMLKSPLILGLLAGSAVIGALALLAATRRLTAGRTSRPPTPGESPKVSG